MRLVPLLAIPLLSAHALAAAQEASPRFSPEGVRAHVTFLADDLLEGRKTGTRGYESDSTTIAVRT